MKKVFSKEVEKYIIENVKGLYVEELVEQVNMKFGTNYTREQIKNYKNRHKLKSGVSKRKPTGPIVFSKEVQDFIANNIKGTRIPDLVNMVNKTFNTSYTYTQISGYTKRYGLKNGLDTTFKKGNIPFNKGLKGQYAPGSEKGWFKKGQVPVNHREVGSERISKDGYIEIKVAEPNKWKLKHRVVWEQHNGQVPQNRVVIFLDGNKLNVDISNLALISRSELKIMNQIGLKYGNTEATKVGVMIAKAIDTKNKRRKKRS